MIRILKISIICCLLYFIGSKISLNIEKSIDANQISADAHGYYIYLPATFINGFENNPHYHIGRAPKTNYVNPKYTFGIAILQSPFFFITHALVSLTNPQETNGYSKYYHYTVLISSLFYTLCGLLLLARYFIKNRSDSWLVFILILCLYFGTNLFYYSSREAGMSHAYSFFLFCWLIVLTPKLYDNFSWKSTLLISIVIGLIIFIRPTNILVLIYVLF